MAALGGLSLRYKLLLFISLTTGGCLLIAGTLAYLAVRGSARVTAEARMESGSRQLVELLGTYVAGRRAVETRVVASRRVRSVLERAPFVAGELAVLLDSLRLDTDGGLPVMILGPQGDTLFQIGSLRAPDPDPTPALATSRVFGPLHAVENDALFWVSLPVLGPDSVPLGWVAQRRRFATAGAGQTIEALLGNAVSLRVGRPGSPAWVDLGGGVHGGPPASVPMSQSVIYEAEDGAELLGVAAPLPGTPWVILLEIPMAAVMQRARTFLGRTLSAGSILIALVIVIAWRSSKRFVAPLRELANAADDMADGDYRRRVLAAGDDEVGRLARAFNSMAQQIQRSQAALKSDLGEATELASALEAAHLTAEQALKEAESENRNKSHFLATMSHELRTPITAVLNYTELLRMGVPDPPTEGQREYLDRIDVANELLVALVNDVLEFSRIESGQLRVREEVGSARDAIQLGVTAMELRARRKGITITSDCPGSITYIGDRRRVQQVVLNLVSNAVRFTGDGGSVTLSCSDDGVGLPGANDPPVPWIRIDVVDNGIGIEKDDLERIFEPFVQAAAPFTWDHGGAGLGLAISQRLASLMSGTITVESEPGKGSRFTLWLRAPAASIGAVGPLEGSPSAAGPGSPPGPPLHPRPRPPRPRR